MRKGSRAIFGFVFVISFFAASAFCGTVPLKSDLPFDKSSTMSKKSITLVIPEDLASLVIKKKMRLFWFDFAIGESVASNAQRALESRFATVKRASSATGAKTDLILEAKSYEVMPKFPMTTFGTYESKVKLTFLLRAKAQAERTIVLDGDGGNRKNANLVLWDSGWNNTDKQQLGKATDLAVLDALSQLLDQFPH